MSVRKKKAGEEEEERGLQLCLALEEKREFRSCWKPSPVGVGKDNVSDLDITAIYIPEGPGLTQEVFTLGAKLDIQNLIVTIAMRKFGSTVVKSYSLHERVMGSILPGCRLSSNVVSMEKVERAEVCQHRSFIEVYGCPYPPHFGPCTDASPPLSGK